MREGLKTLPYLTRRESEMLRVLRSLVEIESFSTDKLAVDRCGARVAAEFRWRGGSERRSLASDTRVGNDIYSRRCTVRDCARCEGDSYDDSGHNRH